MCASGAITNTASWYDSFEAYPSGTLLIGSNGWSGSQTDAGTVTSTQDIVNLLANYTNSPVSGSYPVTGSHTNILALNAEMVNHVQSATGGVVKVDFLALPTWTDTLPQGDTGKQYQICISSNGGLLTVWHHNRTAGTNEWRELAASPSIGTSQWSRFTITHDYSNKMFQIAVNEGSPIADAVGWQAGGASASGSWFYMVQTNGVLAALTVDAAPAYIDDLVVAKRSLSWNRTNFTESATNNGSIDNSSPLLITVSNETFAGSINENFAASGKVAIGGLPSNLVAVAQMVSSTQLSVTFTNTALVHEAVNSTALTLQFQDNAFSLGNAWDVIGNQTNASLTFLNTPILSYTAVQFSEDSANNGTINNTSPILITLANGTFAGGSSENFATNASCLTIGNLPSGLTGEVVRLSSTQLQVKLLGAATQHAVVNDLHSTLIFTFLNGAFSNVPATSVFNVSTNLSILYLDPSSVSYGSTVFNETAANNGTVAGTTISLVNKSFAAGNGMDMVAMGLVTNSHLPSGLTLHIVQTGTQTATLSFTGTADLHAAVNSISNLGITFLDGAFVGANAAAVINYALANLQIQYTDPRSLTYSGASFSEISGGAIDNRHPVTITLAGDTFSGANGSDFVAANKIVTANVPAGLTAQITRNSSTRLSVQFAGRATYNGTVSNVNNVTFTFQNGAFSAGNAIYVGNYAKNDISITFTNDAGFYNVMPYAEPFESYAHGLYISGTNGWTGSSADAGSVTNVPVLISNLVSYATSVHTYPVSSATHTQVLYVQSTLQTEVHSESATNVFVDFLTVPVPMTEAPVDDLTQQWAFYATTNGKLVVWQQTRSGGPSVNQWITLSNAPSISTSQWTRFTIESDYVHDMFRIQINQAAPVADSRGWTAPGGSLGGSWLYMVQTNHVLTSFKMSGAGDGFLDDISINSSLDSAFYPASGSIYLMR